MIRKLFIIAALAATSLFADPHHDGHEQGRPLEPGVSKAGSALVITGKEAGSDTIKILGNSLGLYDGFVYNEGTGRQEIAVTIVRAGKSRTYDLTESLKRAADLSQPYVPIGTELKAGDKLYITDGIGGAPYMAETMTRNSKSYGLGNGYNERYGYDTYFQFDFGGSSYDGSLDIVFDRRSTPKDGLTGQPLPGILTTLAVGGAGGLLLRRRMKRRRNV